MLTGRVDTSDQPAAAMRQTKSMEILPTLGRRTQSTLALLASIVLLSALSGGAQTAYQPAAANLAAREWFQDARFGLFVHWGVYSVLGDGEWGMNNRRIPIADSEKLPAQFNPIAFDPA